MKRLNLLILSLFLSTHLHAEEGSIGLGAAVAVSGFFSPELEEFIIDSVKPGSPAETAGLKVGDKVLAIDGCEIPGCAADDAKKLMKRSPGDILPLLVEDENGDQRRVEIHVTALKESE